MSSRFRVMLVAALGVCMSVTLVIPQRVARPAARPRTASRIIRHAKHSLHGHQDSPIVTLAVHAMVLKKSK